jgi:cysteinyl-tRNA synthetase
VVRYFLLSAHYRAPLNLLYDPAKGNAESFEAAKSALERLDEFRSKLDDLRRHSAAGDIQSREAGEMLDKAEDSFCAALANDLDVSGALGALFGMVKEGNRMVASGELTPTDAASIDDKLNRWDRVLGVLEPDAASAVDEQRIEVLIAERNAARAAKDFARSDAIRQQLDEEGIVLQDTPGGTKWKRK